MRPVPSDRGSSPCDSISPPPDGSSLRLERVSPRSELISSLLEPGLRRKMSCSPRLEPLSESLERRSGSSELSSPSPDWRSPRLESRSAGSNRHLPVSGCGSELPDAGSVELDGGSKSCGRCPVRREMDSGSLRRPAFFDFESAPWRHGLAFMRTIDGLH